MNKFIALAVVLLMPLFTASPSQALFVGYRQSVWSSAESNGKIYPSVDFSPFFSHDHLKAPIYRPFNNISIGPDSVGDEWVADSNSSDFANAVKLLTNGFEDFFGTEHLTFSTILSASETELQGPGFKKLDFTGSSINKMTLQLDSYSSCFVEDYPWSYNDRRPAYLTEYKYTIVYDYQNPPGSPSPVPEPATMILLGTGLLSLVGFNRKKFKK